MAHVPQQTPNDTPDLEPAAASTLDGARRATLAKLAWVTPVMLTLTLSSRDSAASEVLGQEDVPDYQPLP